MYDKFAFNDPEGLPDWFTAEEKKHRFRRPPEVSKELVEMYKERQKADNVKTIKVHGLHCTVNKGFYFSKYITFKILIVARRSLAADFI